MSAMSPITAPTKRGNGDVGAVREQIASIAQMLARVSIQLEPSPQNLTEGDAVEVPMKVLSTVIRFRRIRGSYWPNELFFEPAWDMMLDLLYAELMGQRVSITSACIASGVPATTALRWLTELVDKEIFVRRKDEADGRRTFVELAPSVSKALRSYFVELAKALSD